MEKRFLLWGLLFGLTAIIFGAFGAHTLKNILNTDQMLSFETGVRYQIYHALFLLILSQVDKIRTGLILKLTVIGIFLFSFSIYLLNLRGVLGLEALRFLGPVTPVGGLLLISAWLIAMIRVVKQKQHS